MKVSLQVNGQSKEVDVPENTLLVDILRVHLGLTGTHVGCDTSQCGACTVHFNGRAVKSCTVLAGQAEGAESQRFAVLRSDGEATSATGTSSGTSCC